MSIAKYSFVSWTRQGLGKFLEAPVSGSIRGKVRVEVAIEGGATISNALEILGPGDITGLDPRNIVRVHPEPNTGDFEANYLPFIEFYQDTFLWDYTPETTTGERLRPWLFLLVLAEGEYELTENPQGLDRLSLNASGVFPPEAQSWAWAHVHVNAAAATIPELQSKLESNPDFAVSRLMSPRRLSPTTRYEAFVIPAFETGRLTGLGLPLTGANALASSWGAGQTEFPVYYRWGFQTGLKGDFESLVRELVPRNDLDESIGFRPMDVKNASSPYNISNPTVDEVLLGGAVKPVGNAPPPFPDANWQVEICNLLNLRDGQQKDDFINAATDPVIVPPTYGHWHALVSQLNQGNDTGPVNNGQSIWLHTLNLDPANRAAAGVGVKVVQENQDKYMATAWEQIGSVLEANQLLRQSQLGIEIAVRWWTKHIAGQIDGELVSMVEPLLGNLLCKGQPKPNIYLNIAGSGTPPAIFSPVFRRLSRTGGRLVKKMIKKRNQVKPKYKSFPDGLPQGLSVVPDKRIAHGKDDILFIQHPGHPRPIPLFPCQFPGFPKEMDIVIFPRQYFEYTGGFSDPNGIGVDLAAYIAAWTMLQQSFHCTSPAAPPPPLDLSNILPCIKNHLNPAMTIKDRTLSKIGTEGDLDAITPIMAAPDYPEPMYKKLVEQSADFMLPNLNQLPNNTITLMEANQAFIEAYMVGLNYEMARELLWNEYPTDQRGSYFRQFWDVGKYIVKGSPDPRDLALKLNDIDYIHRWIKWTDLGDHRKSNRMPHEPQTTAPLVLTIRGDLLNRYPEAIIFAVEAGAGGAFNPAGITKYPIFSAKIDPDITFLGFELSEDEARGTATHPGWYFCIKEPVTGPRFGMDIAPDSLPPVIPPPGNWNELHWGHITNTTLINLNDRTFPDSAVDGYWGDHSAHMAAILYQVPVLVAIHASQLLP